ncbi:MAG: hypothetical protein ACT4N4_02835 [Rhodospirillales bacterium]
MSGLFGHYLRGMFPIISSAPATPPAQAEDASSGIDPAAAESVFRSYHHRLGRPPSLDELRQALGLEANGPLAARFSEVESPRVGSTAFKASLRTPDPWEVEAVTRAYLHQLGRPPTDEELRRDLGLARDPANKFLQKVPRPQTPPTPGFFDMYLAPFLRRIAPPEQPPPGGIRIPDYRGSDLTRG